MNYEDFDMEIIQVDNKNCTDFEVDRLFNIFENNLDNIISNMVENNIKAMELLSPTKKIYSCKEPSIVPGYKNVSNFVLVIERCTAFNDTENFGCYMGTFTDKDNDKKLVVKGVLSDNRTSILLNP